MPKAYRLKPGGGVIRTSDGAEIPESMRNKDWAEYQVWLLRGNTPDPEYELAELKNLKIIGFKARAKELADAQTGTQHDKNMLLATLLRDVDAQANLAQARTTEQNDAVNLLNYLIDVDSNLATAITAANDAIDEAALDLVVFVEPALP